MLTWRDSPRVSAKIRFLFFQLPVIITRGFQLDRNESLGRSLHVFYLRLDDRIYNC